eukprot:CAMPEP_0194235054 /NCGR_PEP_ID=MMETSP0158-20130606/2639_1 /TAXON_ID=33649 /ORGANISM="Thalassionema nitzschioides, Strain L26-B" /LENGTH=201 /DNA_ID=CAMNT_0038968403 /DNA_START=60 /DNA_END=665 /DNA_ORIENTATION=-
MKTTLAFLACVAGASAFAPTTGSSKTSSVLKASDYESLVGMDVETGKKFFDPWELSQWIPAEHARKAELANGRSAMLATVGWFWPKFFGTFASDDVTTTDPIEAVMQADPQWWAQFIVLCGVAEFVKYQGELEGKSYTGDGEPVLDWTKTWSKLSDAKKEDIRLRELKNGRLAMLGIASFFSAHFIPGSVPALFEGGPLSL